MDSQKNRYSACRQSGGEGAGMACGSCWNPSVFDKLVQDIVDSAAAGMAVRRRLAVQTY